MYFEPSVDLVFSFEEWLRQADEKKDEKRDTREVCRLALRGECMKGKYCPDRHLRPDKARVCEYWLRGICKKDDKCEFLHEFDIRRMPECYYFANFGECLNPECVFVHVTEEDIKECPYYKRGFCSLGPRCKYKHTRAVFCPNFMAGFCLEGKMCKYAHPKFNHPLEDELAEEPLSYIPQKRLRRDFEDDDNHAVGRRRLGDSETPVFRSLDTVVCFKCGEKGHYANVCPNPARPRQPGDLRDMRTKVTCFNCGEPGHVSSECPRRTASHVNQLRSSGGQGGM
eukprot:EG_transcript_13655